MQSFLPPNSQYLTLRWDVNDLPRAHPCWHLSSSSLDVRGTLSLGVCTYFQSSAHSQKGGGDELLECRLSSKGTWDLVCVVDAGIQFLFHNAGSYLLPKILGCTLCLKVVQSSLYCIMVGSSLFVKLLGSNLYLEMAGI